MIQKMFIVLSHPVCDTSLHTVLEHTIFCVWQGLKQKKEMGVDSDAIKATAQFGSKPAIRPQTRFL